MLAGWLNRQQQDVIGVHYNPPSPLSHGLTC
jgi:hypothetical protein